MEIAGSANRYIVRQLLLLLVIGLSMHCPCLAAKNHRPGPDFTALTLRVQDWINRGYYPGAALLVARGDRVLYRHCFGRYTPDTVVYIASAGKWLAAATIMTAVDEGKLSLDDQARKWIPELRGAAGESTLRQLLSHTSGYPSYQPEGAPRDDYQTLGESVTHIVPLAMSHAPGQQFEYGGLAMQVAGRMAEKATGKDWETLFEERIANPLGMTRTHFSPVDPGEGHSPMLAGGARSTLHDYVRFVDMIAHHGAYHGRRVLSTKAIAAMEADQTLGAVVPRHTFVEEQRGEIGQGIYGLGEWREVADKDGVLVSSPSWAGAYPWIDTRTRTYGVLIAHVNVAKAKAAHFSAFLTSPVLSKMASAILDSVPANAR